VRPRILIVDDDEDVSALLESLLIPRGYDVSVAHTAQAAREAVDLDCFELAVVDGLLPDSNGMDLIREIKGDRPGMRVVFLSHFFRDASSFAELTQELGVSRVLHKPVSPFGFLAHIEQLVPPGEAIQLAPSTDPVEIIMSGRFSTAAAVSPDPSGLTGPIHHSAVPGVQVTGLGPEGSQGLQSTAATVDWEDASAVGEGYGADPRRTEDPLASPAAAGPTSPGPSAPLHSSVPRSVEAPQRPSRPSVPGAKSGGFQRAMEALRESYVSRLEDRLGELWDALRRVQEVPADQQALEEAHLYAHRLAGSAGTFGLRALRRVASSMEAMLEERIGQGDNPIDEEGWQGLSRAMADLRRLARESRSASAGLGERAATVGSVLVLHGDREVLEALSKVQRSRTVKVTTAAKPEDAREEAEAHGFDCVIAHARLGGEQDPLRVAASVRSVRGLEAVPLVFWEADMDVPLRVSSVQAGAALALGGALDGDRVVATVRELVDARREPQARVLVVDDEPEMAEATELVLSTASLRVRILHDSVSLFDELERFRPDAVLLDVLMPVVSGLDACRMIRASARWRDLPVVLMTASNRTELRLAAYEAGADDFLSKQLLDTELLPRLRVRLERGRQARAQSARDKLTGMFLRHTFVDVLEARLSEARRNRQPLSVCLLRLDGFDKLIQGHGAALGDRMLRHLGTLLRSSFRGEDVRGRWDPESFAVAFYGMRGEEAAGLLQAVVDEFRSTEFPGIGGPGLHGACSAGVATWPADGKDLHELFAAVEARLRGTRSQASNGVLFQDPTAGR
jgi:diguanylate cyclase (GGDEF)-like protein